jgi:hypothetical protein
MDVQRCYFNWHIHWDHCLEENRYNGDIFMIGMTLIPSVTLVDGSDITLGGV